MTTARPPAGPDLARISEALVRRAPEISERVFEAILADVPFYRDTSVVSRADLLASVVDNVNLVFRHLGRPGPADSESALLTGRRRAEQGVPLPRVLDAYRVGFRVMWEAAAEVGRASDGITSTDLVGLASRLFGLVDEYSASMSESYRETASFRMLERERERSVLADALLHGQIRDADSLWEAADLLRLPYHGPSSSWQPRAPSWAVRRSPGWRVRWDRRGFAQRGGCSPSRSWEWWSSAARGPRTASSPPCGCWRGLGSG